MSVLTIKNSINNINNFINDVNSNTSSYYMFVGKPLPWNDENNPDDTNTSISQIGQNIYHDIAFGKLLTNNNLYILVPNIPWTNNIIYSQYEIFKPDPYLNSYVVTDTNDVYKCIDNNGGLPSTVKPFIKPISGVFQTGDGYVWKYMYTITATNVITNDFIPVNANTYVVNNAIGGTIDVIRVLNGGANYQANYSGFIQNMINQQSVVLDSGASGINNYYVGSSIYLKAGLGKDQIRPIVSYNGASRVVSVSPNFDTFATLQFDPASVNGSILLNNFMYQSLANIEYNYAIGIFNVGDALVQSDTGASGNIYFANSTCMLVNQGKFANVSLNPFYDLSSTVFTAQTGTVSIANNSNLVIANTANFTGLTVGNFIQIGSNTGNNIRRVTTITNTTQLSVSIPFNQTLNSNTYNKVSCAVEPYSIPLSNTSGVISQLNLSAMEVTYDNVSTNAISYILGETVKEYDAFGIDQSANAIVSYVNTSTIILSNINGTLVLGNYLIGQSSTLKSRISTIVSYPSVTLANVFGRTFVVGQPVICSFGNGTISGSANIVSYSYSPATNSEFIISPTVNITGDGAGATAYSLVNNAIGSMVEVSHIITINNGKGYTFANATITSNNLYGNNAILSPVVAPVYGHGGNPVEELGGKYLGINVTFDTPLNENFYFPTSGSYRQVGIIKNPTFSQLYVNIGVPYRQNLYIQTTQNQFVTDEIVYQFTTKAAGKVVFANTSFLQLHSINGVFSSNAAQTGVNNVIYGTGSNSLANVISTNTLNFLISSNNQYIYQSNIGSVGTLTQVVNTSMIKLGNVSGKIVDYTMVYDPTNNAYAQALNFYVANGSNLTTTFGQRFSQLSRVTISSQNHVTYQLYENVTQDTSNASGTIISLTNDLDLGITSLSGSISTGITLTNSNTSGNGIIIFANSSYIKLTGVQGAFNLGNKVVCLTGNATINNVYSVMVLSNVSSNANFQYNYNIIGQTSNAIGYTNISNTITFPELTYNSGNVLYLNNIKPMDLGLNNKEVFFNITTF